MNVNHYIGFDVHKKSINYCVKMADGQIVEEGRLRATHDALRRWAGRRQEPWRGAMEATLFSGWIYDTLKPFAAELQMGHPAMMKAIGASKKKNDKIDSRKIADLVRCNLLPACYVAPAEMRELRRLLRYRNVVVAQAVRMKNKMSGLLMEVGAEYNKQQLHGKKYFTELMGNLEEVPESVKDLMRLSRGALEMFEATQRQLLDRLRKEPRLVERVAVLESIRGVGEVTALTLGAGNLRPAAVPVHRGCRELLWADLGVGLFRRQAAPGTHLQAAQWTLADRADRGRQTGATMESAIGPGARAGTAAGKPQPRHHGGGAQTGRLFTGGRQIRPTLPHPESARPHNGGGNSGLTTHSELTSGKDGFPTATARRLDGCGPFRSIHSRDGWLRRENQNTPALRSTAAHLLAIHRPFFAVNGLPQGGTPPHGPQLPVSRPAGSLQFNLRGRLRAVPANGCLVPQRRGPNRQSVAKSKS